MEDPTTSLQSLEQTNKHFQNAPYLSARRALSTHLEEDIMAVEAPDDFIRFVLSLVTVPPFLLRFTYTTQPVGVRDASADAKVHPVIGFSSFHKLPWHR
jgi:hypothetical protein